MSSLNGLRQLISLAMRDDEESITITRDMAQLIVIESEKHRGYALALENKLSFNTIGGNEVNDSTYQDKLDDDHAKDLAVEIIVKQLEGGETVRGGSVKYTLDDFYDSDFMDIGLYAESIADRVLKYWAQCKQSGE